MDMIDDKESDEIDHMGESKICQYFIVGMSLIETIINISTDLTNEIIHGLCKNW